MHEDRRCAPPVCACGTNGFDGQSFLKGQLPEKLGSIHCSSPRIACAPVWEPNRRMQAPRALTSQRRKAGPTETEEIAGCAKVGQSVPLFGAMQRSTLATTAYCRPSFLRRAVRPDLVL